jgi:hypothetical protein
VITTLRHLAEIVDVPYRFLRETVGREREAANYRLFRISKRSGGYRFIHEVGSPLLVVRNISTKSFCRSSNPMGRLLPSIPLAAFEVCADALRCKVASAL